MKEMEDGFLDPRSPSSTSATCIFFVLRKLGVFFMGEEGDGKGQGIGEE